LAEASTAELLAELKRRSLGFMAVSIAMDHAGERTVAEAKGSPAMRRALIEELESRFLETDEDLTCR